MRNPHWFGEPENEVHDLCLHANVLLKIDEEVVDPGTSVNWTVSAGDLRFLRSLFDDHS